jgi:uncharacterized glyoxalase superfamily protein PhnB
VNGHSEIALYVDTFDEVDAAFKNAIENGATPVLEPELEPWDTRRKLVDTDRKTCLEREAPTSTSGGSMSL